MKEVKLETMEKNLKEMGFDYEIRYNNLYNCNFVCVVLGNDEIPLYLDIIAGNTSTILSGLDRNQMITLIRNHIIEKEQKAGNGFLREKDIDKDGDLALTYKELDQLDSFNECGIVSKKDLELSKQRRNELFNSLDYLTDTQKEVLAYK